MKRGARFLQMEKDAERRREKNRKGVCYDCKDKLDPKSNLYCSYHRGFRNGYQTATYKWKNRIEKLLIKSNHNDLEDEE